MGESLAGKRLSPIFGTLSLRPESLAFTSGETFTDCVFKDSAGRHVVLDWPGVDVPAGELLATWADCESVRQRRAVAVTPEMRDAARPPAPPALATEVIQAMQDAATDAALRVSIGEAYKTQGHTVQRLAGCLLQGQRRPLGSIHQWTEPTYAGAIRRANARPRIGRH